MPCYSTSFHDSEKIGSASIMMNLILKLIRYCKLGDDVKIIRMGSSGGLGVKPVTLIITQQAYDPLLYPFPTFQKNCLTHKTRKLPTLPNDEVNAGSQVTTTEKPRHVELAPFAILARLRKWAILNGPF